MTHPITITDNGIKRTYKRRILGVQQNHDFSGFHGFLRFRGTEIRAYQKGNGGWEADTSDTLIKNWDNPPILQKLAPKPPKPEPRPMTVTRYFSGCVKVTVKARSREEAIAVAEQYPVDSFQAENSTTFDGCAVEVEEAPADAEITSTEPGNEDLITKHIRSKFDE